MKVAILAGGRGSRFPEETAHRPKPMIEIGGKPILWHIMRHYRAYGHHEFAIALGYKGDVIRRWAADLTGQATTSPHPAADGADWHINLVETGATTNTGGRIKALADTIGDERFMLTWGDGVSNVDLDALLAFHKAHGKLATVTVVRPPPRFGHVDLDGDHVAAFVEKPPAAEGWINGAFFVLEPQVFSYIDGPDTQFEHEPMQRLARDGELMAFRHEGFWQCMDTIRDKETLEALCVSGKPPWQT